MVKKSHLSAALALAVIICAHSIRHDSGQTLNTFESSKFTRSRVPLFLCSSSRFPYAESIVDRAAFLKPSRGRYDLMTCRVPSRSRPCRSLDFRRGAVKCLAMSDGPQPEQANLQAEQTTIQDEISNDEAYNRGVGGREMDPLHRPIIEKLREVESDVLNADSRCGTPFSNEFMTSISARNADTSTSLKSLRFFLSKMKTRKKSRHPKALLRTCDRHLVALRPYTPVPSENHLLSKL
jgi:hypothetical protein